MKSVLSVMNFLGTLIEAAIDGLFYFVALRFLRSKPAYIPEMFPPMAPAKQPEAQSALPAVSPTENESLGVRYIVSSDIL